MQHIEAIQRSSRVIQIATEYPDDLGALEKARAAVDEIRDSLEALASAITARAEANKANLKQDRAALRRAATDYLYGMPHEREAAMRTVGKALGVTVFLEDFVRLIVGLLTTAEKSGSSFDFRDFDALVDATITEQKISIYALSRPFVLTKAVTQRLEELTKP